MPRRSGNGAAFLSDLRLWFQTLEEIFPMLGKFIVTDLKAVYLEYSHAPRVMFGDDFDETTIQGEQQ